MICHSASQHRKSLFLQDIPITEVECDHWATFGWPNSPTRSLTKMLNEQKKTATIHSAWAVHPVYTGHQEFCWRMTGIGADSVLVFTRGNWSSWPKLMWADLHCSWHLPGSTSWFVHSFRSSLHLQHRRSASCAFFPPQTCTSSFCRWQE